MISRCIPRPLPHHRQAFDANAEALALGRDPRSRAKTQRNEAKSQIARRLDRHHRLELQMMQARQAFYRHMTVEGVAPPPDDATWIAYSHLAVEAEYEESLESLRRKTISRIIEKGKSKRGETSQCLPTRGNCRAHADHICRSNNPRVIIFVPRVKLPCVVFFPWQTLLSPQIIVHEASTGSLGISVPSRSIWHTPGTRALMTS